MPNQDRKPVYDSFAQTLPGAQTALIASLRQSEEKYRSVIENLGEGMLIIQDGVVVFANNRAAEVLRVAHASMQGADYLQWMHPDERAMVSDRQIRRQRGEAVVPRYEIRLLDFAGQVRFVEMHATRASWEGRDATISFFSDSTERKRMLESVQRSEQRYRSVVENLGEGMMVVLDGRIVFVNQQASHIMHIAQDDMMSADPLVWIHPDDRSAVLALRIQLRDSESPAFRDGEFRIEARHIGADGVVRWLNIRPVQMDWEGRRATMTFFSEVTERRAMLDALQRSEERYRAVVEHLGEGMMVIQSGVIVFANPQANEIIGSPAPTLVGMHSVDLIHPDDRNVFSERQLRRERGEKISVNSEIRMLDAYGQVRWLGTHSSSAQWEGHSATMSFFSDITERKAMVMALHRSEERYRAVIDHVGDGMVVVQDARFVFANPRAAEIMQMPVADMMREGYLHRIHPDDHAIVDERRRRRLAGESMPNRYEIRLVMPDGQIKWIDIGVTIVPWDGARATLTFFSDVTTRKALEAQLQQTLDERETILESSIVGIAFLTPEGRFRWANQAMLQIFGSQRGTEILTSIESLYLSREQYLSIGAKVAQCIAHGEVFATELQMRRLDGSTLWASLSGKAVSLRDLTQGTVWVVMDISRRKELEEALLRTSAEREAILNSALVGMVLSVQRRQQWVNDKFLDMVGYTRAELIGQTSQLVNADAERWQIEGEQSRRALELYGHYSGERQLKRRNGELFWVQMTGRCLRDKDPESGVIWTFLDITERRKAEDDTRAALARQQELNELRSRFVAMTSHEFRTPLATILSSAELLKYYGERLSVTDQAEVLGTIESAVQRMTRMLDRVLLLGKAEAHMLEFKPERLDLALLCQRLAEEALAQQPDTPCQLELELDPTLTTGVFDEKLLRHIFGNLLSNALKYSPQGGLVRFSAKVCATHIRFEISDQGIGIPQDELSHLFESFHRASNVGNIQGTGLGLAIVKNSVDLHGGRIEVHSEHGRGSRFIVEIDSTRQSNDSHVNGASLV